VKEAVMTKAGKTNPVNWFEIPVKDMARAKRFYEKAFRFKLCTSEMTHEWGTVIMAFFPMEQGAGGATGTLIKGPSYRPSRSGTVVYFTVKDIGAALRRIRAGGGKIVMPKTRIGEYGAIAQFEDTEGNRLALHSMK
jgi:predicted enzyme related to lactoylglutathione lyase